MTTKTKKERRNTERHSFRNLRILRCGARPAGARNACRAGSLARRKMGRQSSHGRALEQVIKTASDQDRYRKRHKPSDDDPPQHRKVKTGAGCDHGPGDPRRHDVRCAHGKSAKSRNANHQRGNCFGGGALRRRQVDFSKALTERRDDALISDHRAYAETQRAEDPYPPGRIGDRLTELLGERLRSLFVLLADALWLLRRACAAR